MRHCNNHNNCKSLRDIHARIFLEPPSFIGGLISIHIP